MSLRGFQAKTDSDTSSITHSDSNSQKSLTDLSDLFNNILNLNSEKENNMARPVIKKEYLDMVPDFKGEPELLPRFIEISEKLINKFYNHTDVNDFDNEYLLSSIFSKIKGQAAINISCCTINSFEDIKNALLNAYSDKRDIYTLQIEMTEFKQGLNESPFDFYNRIQKYLNLQISYINTKFVIESRHIIKEYCKNYALRVLLRGLKEPIGSLMRTKNPTDLNEALNMLTNDFQLDVKTKTNNPNIKINPKFTPNTFNYTIKKPLQQQFKFQPYPSTSNANNFPNRNFSNQQTKNVFKPGINKNLSKPTPMSISTRNTFQRPQPQLNQNSQNRNTSNNFIPKFTSEELFNIDEQQNLESSDNCNELNENENYFSNQEIDCTDFENEETTFLENTALDPFMSC